MRLTPSEVACIKNIIHAVDAQSDVYLYGSRVDDEKRGGDIDLLVISNKIDFNAKLEIMSQLYCELGEQKIDLLIERDFSKAFTSHIKETALKL